MNRFLWSRTDELKHRVRSAECLRARTSAWKHQNIILLVRGLIWYREESVAVWHDANVARHARGNISASSLFTGRYECEIEVRDSPRPSLILQFHTRRLDFPPRSRENYTFISNFSPFPPS